MPQKMKESVYFTQEEQVNVIRSANFETLCNMIKRGKLSLQAHFKNETPSNLNNLNSKTILHFIVMRKERDRLKLLEWVLINRLSEIDINAKTDNGYTPLTLAAEFDNIEAMKLLIAYGADTEIRAPSKETALEIYNRRLPLQVNSIKQAIKDRKEGKLPSPKPIFLTEEEAGLVPAVKENQSANASQDVLNILKNKFYTKLAFWKHASNQPAKEEVPLLEKKTQ